MLLHRRITWLCLTLAWLASSAIAWAQPPMHAPTKTVRPGKFPVRQAAASQPVARALQASHEERMHNADVSPVQYMAQHDDPSEPLGFSGARFSPGTPVDPGFNSGVLYDEPVEFSDPLDPEGPAPAVSSGEWIRSGCWYTEQDVVYFSRSTNPKNEIRLAVDNSSAVIPSELAHLDINPNAGGYAPGWRATLGRYLGRDPRNRDHSVEFTFLGFTHWGDGVSLTAKTPGFLFSEIERIATVPVYNQGNFQSYSQTSKMNSFELNYRIGRRLGRDQLVYSRDSQWVRRCDRALLPAIFGGIRVVSVPETLQYLGTSSVGTASYDIATHNNMVGLQGGAEFMFEQYEWQFGLRMKGGGLVNWANQSSRVRILSNAGAPLVPNRDEFAEAHELSFVGGMTFLGGYAFTPNFAFRTSYDLMWITNLALAQNQITFSPSTPPQVSNHHSLFYQGASIGLEWTR